MTNEEEVQKRMLDVAAKAAELLADDEDDSDEDMDDLDQIKKDIEVQSLWEEEQAQCENAHREGIVDALQVLLAQRERLDNQVLLSLVGKIAMLKLFDPPF